MPYLYLLINGLTLSVPLILSFDRKVQFYKKWPWFFAALLPVIAAFLIWDEWFARMGVWGFNPRYLSGIYLGHLPLEEYLFFICVPYACVFIYETIKAYVKNNPLRSVTRWISIVLLVPVLIALFTHTGHWYSLINFSLAALLLLFLVLRNPSFSADFYLFYFIQLLPFTLVNGLLTGSFIEEEVVWYNNMENMGIRLFTIPLEDFMYSFSLMFLIICAMEYFYREFKPGGA